MKQSAAWSSLKEQSLQQVLNWTSLDPLAGWVHAECHPVLSHPCSSLYPCIYLSIDLPAYLSSCPSARLSIYLSLLAHSQRMRESPPPCAQVPWACGQSIFLSLSFQGKGNVRGSAGREAHTRRMGLSKRNVKQHLKFIGKRTSLCSFLPSAGLRSAVRDKQCQGPTRYRLKNHFPR